MEIHSGSHAASICRKIIISIISWILSFLLGFNWTYPYFRSGKSRNICFSVVVDQLWCSTLKTVSFTGTLENFNNWWYWVTANYMTYMSPTPFFIFFSLRLVGIGYLMQCFLCDGSYFNTATLFFFTCASRWNNIGV